MSKQQMGKKRGAQRRARAQMKRKGYGLVLKPTRFGGRTKRKEH